MSLLSIGTRFTTVYLALSTYYSEYSIKTFTRLSKRLVRKTCNDYASFSTLYRIFLIMFKNFYMNFFALLKLYMVQNFLLLIHICIYIILTAIKTMAHAMDIGCLVLNGTMACWANIIPTEYQLKFSL